MGNNGLIDLKSCFSPAWQCMLLQLTWISPMPCCSARCLHWKFSITVTTVYTQRYNRIHWLQSWLLLACCRRLPVHARFRRSPAASAGACPLCWRRPNKPMLMIPAEARREAQSTRQAQRRRPKQSKTLKLEVQNPPQTWIEAQSARQGQKRLSN